MTKERPARQPKKIKLGDVLGDQLRSVQKDRDRRRELEEMGFKPIGGKR